MGGTHDPLEGGTLLNLLTNSHPFLRREKGLRLFSSLNESTHPRWPRKSLIFVAEEVGGRGRFSNVPLEAKEGIPGPLGRKSGMAVTAVSPARIGALKASGSLALGIGLLEMSDTEPVFLLIFLVVLGTGLCVTREENRRFMPLLRNDFDGPYDHRVHDKNHWVR